MAQPNFGLLNTNLPAEIAGSVQRGQDEALRSQMAQQQQEMSGMQLDQLKRDRDALTKMQQAFVANGKSPDLESNFDEMIKSGIAHYVDIGIKGKQKLMEQKQFANIMGGGAPSAPAAAPTNALAAPATAPMNALAPSTPAAPAAPVNALAAPATGPDVTELRRKRDMLLSMGTTQSIAAARAMDADIALASKEPVYHNVPGVGLVDPRSARVVMPEGVKDSEFEKLLKSSNLSESEKNRLRIQRAQKEATHAPGTTVNLPPQEKAFESELGKGQAEGIIKSKTAAQDASSIINTVKTGRDLMKSGMITGAGADFLVNLNQGLKTVGIDAGLADAAANSQAFTAAMGANVGKLIKQFGAGTGLSNDDRKFATDMAGGRISLDAKAITRILDINERAARNVITQHNKDVKGIKTNIPLEVEMPPEIKATAASNAVTNPQFPGFSIGKP